jgi:ligand-binding sensor domain-containing protein/signal transduction histidine kinase/ActR/RegA family two-component response regulator
MIKIYSNLIIGLFIFFSIPGLALHYNFGVYSLEEGLGQSQVYCVFQDSRGFLWCGTFGGGASKFNGKTFKNYTEEDGLCNNVVYCIMEDRSGNLWFGTDEGAAKYDRKTFTTYTTKNGLIQNSVFSILEDRKGNLWFGTYNGGISKFNGKTFENYSEKDGLIHNRIFSILQDREGNLWFSTMGGASKLNIETKTFTNYTEKDGLIDNKIRFILEDRNGDLWFATSRGVSKYDGRNFTHITTKDGLCDNRVWSVFQDHKGHYWFATERGISEYNGATFTNYSAKNGLPHHYVQSICEDLEGNLWFGTDGGLCKLSGKLFNYLSTKNGLKDNMVWAIRQDQKGVIWVSTDSGISKYYGDDKPIVTSKEGIPGDAAYPIIKDSKGNIWFGSSEFIVMYDRKRYRNLTLEKKLSRHLVLDIFEDSSGNIWVGTQDGGVKIYDGKNFRQLIVKDGLAHNTVNAIKEDKHGNILIATEGGLSIYNGQTFKNITVKDGLPSRYVMCLLLDACGNIWLGTYGGGVVKYTPTAGDGAGKIDIFSIKDGLSDSVVLLMIFDDFGNLLIGTNSGINKLDAGEFDRTGQKLIKQYDKYEGFRGIECNQNAVFKDKDGNIWFGTVRGAIKYNPKEEVLNKKEPVTHITDLKLFYEKVSLSDYSEGEDEFGLPVNLALPHTQNHITFEFIGISLTAPEKVNYQVQLEGFEKNWTPISKTTAATYSNLSPGDYTFKVKACNNHCVWNKYPTIYHFRIIAPFWQEWWFYLLCIAALLSSLYTFIKIRTRSLERQRKLLEEKINERTLELIEEKAKVEKINHGLEQRVQERTEKLLQANKRLMRSQKMEAIGRLASGVAHDLNNVLAGIVTLPEILTRRIKKDDPLREYLLMIRNSGEKAAAIVQDLLTLARRGIATVVNVNLNEVITEYLRSPEFAKLSKDHPAIKAETHFENSLHYILASPIHLIKTIMNLVSNAAEAMPGGGKIEISTENRFLDQPISGYEDVEVGEYTVLSITDEGIGISADDLERIFEPFYTKKHMGRSGTGLGMAVVWGTVQDHNGYIEVQSTEGKGTRVTIYFPKTMHRVEMGKLKPKEKIYKGNGEIILVVDDEKEQREIASLALSDLGFKVVTAASGEEAIEYLKANSVDLLMLDMIMEPGIDGCETYKNIIAFKPDQKAIIISGFSEDQRVKKAQKMGAGAFLKKPYLQDEIYKTIKTELERDGKQGGR